VCFRGYMDPCTNDLLPMIIAVDYSLFFFCESSQHQQFGKVPHTLLSADGGDAAVTSGTVVHLGCGFLLKSS